MGNKCTKVLLYKLLCTIIDKLKEMEFLNTYAGEQIINFNYKLFDKKINNRFEFIGINFGTRQLIMSVNDLDEIVIDYSLNKDFKPKLDFLSELTNKQIIWIWKLTNNKGYNDGIQIEFADKIIIQFMAEASAITIYELISKK